MQMIEEQGRTKRWIARYCGLSLESLNHYLTGRRNPRLPILKLLAQALNVQESSLIIEDQEEARRTG